RARDPCQDKPCTSVFLDGNVILNLDAGPDLGWVLWVKGQIHHFADLDAVVLHRAANGKPPDGFVENDDVMPFARMLAGLAQPQREKDGQDGNKDSEGSDQYMMRPGFHSLLLRLISAARLAAPPRGP